MELRMNDERLPGQPGTDTDLVMAKMLGLADHADEFGALEYAVRALSDLMPARVSLRQGLAFLFVVHANAHGRRVTMTDVRDSFSEVDTGAANVGQSLARSFQIFLKLSDEDPEGLGWITQETDRDDKRKKYLRVTGEGAEIALKIISYIHSLKSNRAIQHQEKA